MRIAIVCLTLMLYPVAFVGHAVADDVPSAPVAAVSGLGGGPAPKVITAGSVLVFTADKAVGDVAWVPMDPPDLPVILADRGGRKNALCIVSADGTTANAGLTIRILQVVNGFDKPAVYAFTSTVVESPAVTPQPDPRPPDTTTVIPPPNPNPPPNPKPSPAVKPGIFTLVTSNPPTAASTLLLRGNGLVTAVKGLGLEYHHSPVGLPDYVARDLGHTTALGASGVQDGTTLSPPFLYIQGPRIPSSSTASGVGAEKLYAGPAPADLAGVLAILKALGAGK